MKKKFKRPSRKNLLLSLAALALVAGSFSVASGDVLSGPSSLLASVAAAISGQPTLIVSRDKNSVNGTLPAGQEWRLATFNLKPQNVSQQVTMVGVSGQVVTSSAAASWLWAWPIHAYYSYCIPAGKKYGYGWTGKGGCQTIQLNSPYNLKVSSANKITGIVSFYFSGNIPVYPEASVSQLIISGTPQYVYTGAFKQNGASDGSLHVELTNIGAVGDQCSTVYYGYKNKYSYSRCVLKSATANIVNNGPTLKITRPYGYGYKGLAVAPKDCTFNGKTVKNGGSVTAYQTSSVVSPQKCAQQTRTCTNGALSGSYQYASCTVQPVPAVVSGKVWVDANGNKTIDSGEQGMPGQTVQLLNSQTNTSLQQTTTDSSGAYSLSTTPGSYRIQLTMPQGYTRTTDNSFVTTLSSGSNTRNFGIKK